jgi:hypothetical protein
MEDEKGRACNTHRKMINAYKMLIGKPVGNRPLGIPKRRWEDNIKMPLKEIW